MPASFNEPVNPIEETLKASLGNKNSLDQQLVANSVKILMQDIEFQPAKKSSTFQLENIRSKYVPLNSQKDISTKNSVGNGNESKMSVCKSNDVNEDNDGIPVPKVDLFPAGKISQTWSRVRKVGSGLQNMGNTCFLNSTLQCLTYTAPLVTYLETDDHPSKCKIVGFCMVCELQRHIKRCYENGGQTIRPHSILVKLKFIAKHMHWGRQEDAHEFLRYLVDAMQKACLNGYNKLDKYSKETTVINRIFGGFLRSQVQCLRCKERSNTFDPFQDINLDIKNVPNIQKAFEKFVQPETLDCDNAYNCPRCKHKGSATKRLSLHRPSNILTIQLKRFDYNRFFGGKVSRHINFTEQLDIRPYMSHKQGEPIIYHLYAVLVHSGSSCNSGHYYCYIKAPNQTWYCMNDSNVSQVSLHRVMSSEAYMLFYSKATQDSHSTNNNHIKLKAVNRPSFSNKSKPAALGSNKTMANGVSDHDLGKPVDRVTIGPHLPPSRPNPSMIAAPAKRDKISFGINTMQKPRIVLNIKKNSSGYIVENGKTVAKKKSPLVPYDLDSDQENKSSPGSSDEIEAKNSVPTLSTANSEKVVPSNVTLSKSAEQVDKRHSKPDNYGNIFTNLTRSESDILQMSPKQIVPKKPLASLSSPMMKRPFSNQQLTCITTSPRVNATTPWHILHKDSQVSPSIGSDTSNISCNSTNSTSDWKVEEKVDKQRISSNDINRLTAGWTVTSNESSSSSRLGSKLSKNSNSAQNNSDVVSNSVEEPADNIDSEKQSNKNAPVEETVTRHSDSESKSELDSLDNENKEDEVCSAEWVVKSPPKLNDDDDDEDADGDKRSKKVKKHKKHKRKREDSAGNDENEETRRKHKKKKHKHKHKRRHHREDGEVSSDDQSEETEKSDVPSSTKKKEVTKIYDWVEKTKEKIVKKEYSSKRGAEEDMNQYRALAEVEKFMTKPTQPRSMLPKIMTKGKREKNKDKPDTSLKEAGEIPADEGNKEPIESPKEARTTETDAKKETKSSEVPSTYWDHRVNDGYSSKSHVNHQSKYNTSWDGSRSCDVTKELLQQSLHGYGSAVNSWNGGKNNIDNEVVKDRARDSKRTWSDDYDDEVDRGRSKKIRKDPYRKSEPSYSFNTGNPFQRHHDRSRGKHWSSHRDYNHSGSYWTSSHSYHQQHANGHHGRYQHGNHGRY